ncbi:MAG: helix-turn-helix transcriptional regulator, partial [Verrucomicrobiota bacterium]
LGETIKKQRINKVLKQAELASRAGVSRLTVSNLENGQSIHTKSLAKILLALDLSILDAVPEVPISPIDLARLKGKQRERVR